MLYLNLLINIIPLLAIIPLIAAFFLPFYSTTSRHPQNSAIEIRVYVYLTKVEIILYNIFTKKNVQAEVLSLDNDNNTVKLLNTVLALLIILIIGCVIQIILNVFSNKLFHDLVSLLILLLSVLTIGLVSYIKSDKKYEIDTGAILCFVFLSIIFLKEALTNKIIKNIIKNIQ